MMIETKELLISDELNRELKIICRFANDKYSIKNVNIKSIKAINKIYFVNGQQHEV